MYGFDQPLIAQDRLTVAHFLKQRGYATAAFGKWHLGMDFPKTNDRPIKGNNPQNIDWKGDIENGPIDRGFEYFFGISASLDMPPYIYIENNKFVGEGTAMKTFLRQGPAEPDFEAVDVLPMIGRKAQDFVSRQNASTPFFAYIALNSPHTPIVPSAEWQGMSPLGAYGDFVMQSDAVIGNIVTAVDAAGFGNNTLIIVTSDNGCSKAADIANLQAQGHYPSAHFRGSKADLWDGGHRVPFLVRWPQVVEPASTSDQLICQIDLLRNVCRHPGPSGSRRRRRG